MNLVLLHPEDFTEPDLARLGGRRLQHLQNILRVQVGDELKVGRVNGPMGTGTVLSVDQHTLVLRTQLTSPAPTPLPLHLVLALPRPIVLKRLLGTITTLGVKQITLLQTARVEKSFWQSPVLAPQALREQLLLGLEQARDTMLPTIDCETRFNPFVQDRLKTLLHPTGLAPRLGLVAHPGATSPCPLATRQPTVLFVGPEGGFINAEIDQLIDAGCSTVHLGNRILKVEVALTALLSRFYAAA